MMTEQSLGTKSPLEVLKGPLSPIPGWLPVRVDTPTAELLAALLLGEDVSGIDPRFAQPAAPAASTVRYLEDRLCWRIQRRKFAYSTDDGRLWFATKYSLSADVLKNARASGAEDWIERVRAAAASRLANADVVKDKVATLNGCGWFARLEQGAAQ